MNHSEDLGVYWTRWPKDDPPNSPDVVIDHFFDLYELEEARTLMWQMIKHAVQSPAIRNEGLVSDLAFFYEMICDLITMSYVQHKQLDARKNESSS